MMVDEGNDIIGFAVRACLGHPHGNLFLSLAQSVPHRCSLV
jgi:hypothetical protein